MENGTMRVICFYPENWRLLDNFQKQGTSCVISSVARTKPNEVKLTNHTAVKAKTLIFPISPTQKITFLEVIISKLELCEYGNVQMKFVQEGNRENKNRLALIK